MKNREHMSQWQVAANAPENYERFLVPSIFGPWATDLVSLGAPKQGERVLDAACGTGIVARLSAKHVAPGGCWSGYQPGDGRNGPITSITARCVVRVDGRQCHRHAAS